MKALLLILLAVFTHSAFAQMDVQEVYSKSRLKILGRDFGFSFFSLASVETDKFNDEGGRVQTYNYLTSATRFGDDYRGGLRLPFTYSTAGTDRFDGDKVNGQQLDLQDIILFVQQPHAFLMPWDLDLFWEGRVYAPTSKASIDQGLIARVRADVVLAKVVNRWLEFDYDGKFNYYFQSRSTYSAGFDDAQGFPVTNPAATTHLTKRSFLDHWVDVWGKIAPGTGAGWMLGEEDTTWYSSAAEGKSKSAQHMIKTGPQVRFSLSDSTNFIFEYSDVVDRDNDRAEFGRFLAKNTQFTLLSFIGF
jgi:hypothetical protein